MTTVYMHYLQDALGHPMGRFDADRPIGRHAADAAGRDELGHAKLAVQCTFEQTPLPNSGVNQTLCINLATRMVRFQQDAACCGVQCDLGIRAA